MPSILNRFFEPHTMMIGRFKNWSHLGPLITSFRRAKLLHVSKHSTTSTGTSMWMSRLSKNLLRKFSMPWRMTTKELTRNPPVNYSTPCKRCSEQQRWTMRTALDLTLSLSPLMNTLPQVSAGLTVGDFPLKFESAPATCKPKLFNSSYYKLISDFINYSELLQCTLYLYQSVSQFSLTIYSVLSLNIHYVLFASSLVIIYSIFILLNIVLITYLLRIIFLILHFSLFLPVDPFYSFAIVLFCYLFVTLIFLSPIQCTKYLLTYLFLSKISACRTIYLATEPGACIITEQPSAQVLESLTQSQVPIVSFLTVTENKTSKIK
jgi:hypothetical protein